MKFIKTLDGNYINVERADAFDIVRHHDYDNEKDKRLYYFVRVLTSEKYGDIFKHDKKEAAQVALDELMAKINGGKD